MKLVLKSARPFARGGILFRLLVLGAAAAAGWIWWQGGSISKSAKGTPVGESSSLREAVVQSPASPPPVRPPGPLPLVPVVRMRATNSAQIPSPTNPPALAEDVLAAQLVLARLGLSPGSLDGQLGSQTRAALRAYYDKVRLAMPPETAALGEVRALLATPIFTNRVVTGEDLGRLLPLGATWLAKSQQARLDYESILELVAEQSWSHPNLIRRLNPGVNWSNVTEGASVRVPGVEPPPAEEKAAWARIYIGRRVLQAFGASSNLLAHFPCSIAQRVEKRPVGEQLSVVTAARGPNYTFDPEVFSESAEARQLGRKLILQPGPNNPVGTVWIGLDRPGYGIHGTPRPEDVGRTESHGCFRLANWNAEHLFRLVWVGMPVQIEP